jgi:transcriptional regulator GlxA family with amidase domain
VTLRVGFMLAAELGFVEASHMSRCFKNEDSRRIFD